MKIGSNGIAYCDCGKRIGKPEEIGDTTQCDVCSEITEWAKDKAFLRELRERRDYENRLETFKAAYPDKVPQVGSSNYIRAEVKQPEGRPPFVMITMMVGDSGKYIEYSYEQFEGLMILLTDIRTDLRSKL